MGKAGKRKLKKFLSFGLSLVMAMSGVDMTTLTALAAAETVSSGDASAYVAEVPEVSANGQTAEEADGSASKVSDGDAADVSAQKVSGGDTEDQAETEAENVPAAEADGERVKADAAGHWTINTAADNLTATATHTATGVVYHAEAYDSAKNAELDNQASGGKDYVAAKNLNGLITNGIVQTAGTKSGYVSWADYTAPYNGTLTLYVGTTSGTKDGAVSTATKNIGSFSINTAAEAVSTDGLTMTPGTTWHTVCVEVEKDVTYYVTVGGSKMKLYDPEFAPYTVVTGTISGVESLSGLKFVNKETANEVKATVTGTGYSVELKPGSYTIAIDGEDVASKAIAGASRELTVAGSDTATPNNQTHNVTVEEATLYTVSGSLTGVEAVPSGMKIVFVPKDSTSFDNVTATITGLNYSAMLMANEEYTVELQDAKDYELAGEIKVSGDGSQSVTQDIALSAVATYAVSGNFIGLGETRGNYVELSSVAPTKITFTDADDNQYVYEGTASAGGYTVELRDGAYVADITADGYSTSTHVVVDGKAVTRDLLLKDTTSKAGTVAYTETVYVGKDKAYKTVQAAVDAVSNMSRTDGQRVTIKIDPGTYREQVVVRTPNITFESNGGDRDDTKITWYYGIGYKYYSCVNSYYDPYADYDQYEKGSAVKFWGSAVIVESAGKGFKAKGITFENSFNKYMTDEEIADGAEPDGLQKINVKRDESTRADSKAATERAAAMVNYADQVEFKDCSFIGSQDTLYTCNVAYDSYYKNCYIEGQTDFIYGNGNVIFDGCELNFCGYSETEAAGYLTAQSSAEGSNTLATTGYVFRNCYVSYNGKRKVTAGYWGRMWGKNCKVAFINTKLEKSDMIVAAGWASMGSPAVNPTDSTVTLVEYNTTCNGAAVSTAGRVAGVAETLDVSKYTVPAVFTGGWTPSYYTPEVDTAPAFKTNPAWGYSNGDWNTPNPGETYGVSYELGEDWEANDASKIDWYAVEAVDGLDSMSLEEILEHATLIKSSSAVQSKKFQLTMDFAGKYFMAVVTPMTINGLAGTAKYVINLNSIVSSTWLDPDNEGSIAPGSGINIYLAGDSTVKDYSALGMYNNGSILSAGSWGEFLQYFFNEEAVTVNNYAQGGRACRSFINEGKLDSILKNIKEGDYLFVQFGHNDCANDSSNYADRFVPLYTADTKASTVKGSGGAPTSNFPTIKPTDAMKNASGLYDWNCGATYKGFIQVYIDEALAKGAIPVIVTPVARVYYSGSTIRTHHDAPKDKAVTGVTEGYETEGDAYVTACRELYEENIAAGKNVLLLDAFAITKQMYEDAYANGGGASCGYAVMDVKTDGGIDYTHSNKTGGVIQAGLVAKELQGRNLSLSQYIIQPTRLSGVETSGEYIFTIDKDGKFVAKDKKLVENEYWSEFGQNLFDSIGGKSTTVNEVILDFGTQDALDKYETNASESFTDGVYSGVYTNEAGQKFKAAVYQSGVQYYNSTLKYGTKATAKKAVFSFVASKAGTYTVTSTVGTGSGTLDLYSDAECTNSVASAATGTNLVYKKSADGDETLYYASSAASNLYVKTIEISYAEPKAVSLTYSDDAVMTLYETEETYTDGEYSGDYTNADGQKFDVTVYKPGTSGGYYNHTARYGTKAPVKEPLFSFTATDAAMYKVATTIGTGSGTVDLFADKECTTSVAQAKAGETIVYKKRNSNAETLYFAASDVSNLYIATASISKEELPEDVILTIKGELSGLEATDTNVVITFKGSTETKTVLAEDYSVKGIALIEGEQYVVSAKGDKGIYTSYIVTPREGDDAKQIDLSFDRLGLDFPFDFVENYADYKNFIEAMGGSSDVTDLFSGITVHPNGIVFTDAYREQYGVKTNANDILSFKAAVSGEVTVNVTVSGASNDTLVLKVNGQISGEPVSATAGTDAALTATVKKGDTVTVHTPTRSNLWYKTMDVSYVEDPDAEEPETVSISFDLNYTDAPAMEAMTVNKGGLVYAGEIVKPSRTGYTFAGWLKGESAASFPLTVTEDITLIAKWNMNNYTVAFDANCDNATGEMANEAFSYDVSKKLSGNEYVRAGYDFAGWSLAAVPAESDKIYEDEEAVSRLTAEKDGVVTLYAQWKAATYTVTFDKNGGTGDGMDAMSVTYGEAAKKLTRNIFTNGTKKFMGWASSAENAAAGTVAYADEAEVSNLTTDLTLYAIWKDVYTVTFDSKGGSAVEAQDIVSGGMVTKPADPTNGTLIFAGWYADEACTDENAYAFTTPVTKSFTLYAKWTEKKAARTIWLVGDSTVCEYIVDNADKTKNTDQNYYYRRYGYGMMLGQYFDDEITIKNLALSGRSSLSFLAEDNYKALTNATTGIKSGDVLIIGFGHNDAKAETARYTNPNGDWQTEGSFAKSLYDNYVKVAEDAGATAILCTPIVRRPKDGVTFTDSECHIWGGADGFTGGDYPAAIRKLASDKNIPLVDMTQLTKALYTELGATENAYLHAWTTEPKEGGVTGTAADSFIDNTHTNSWGASYNAYFIAKAIKENNFAGMEDRVENVDAAPAKAATLVQNSQYVKPTYTRPTTTSTIWPDVDVWHGTVFGNAGGQTKITKENFTLEASGTKDVHIVAKDKGKIEAADDGMAMYYYAVPAGKPFRLSAKVKVNSYTADSQSAFGLIARDTIYIDTNSTSIADDYVVAGTYGTKNAVNCFKRQSGTLDTSRAATISIADLAQEAAEPIDLSIVYNGDGYECTFGNQPTVSGGFDFQLTSMDSEYVYVGMFAIRKIDVTFSDISLIVDGEVITGEAPAPLSNDHTVTFVSNGGSAVAAQTVSDGDVAAEPADPTKENAEFYGWYTDSNYAEGSEYNFSSKVTKDITLYARWVYTFTFMSNGGTAVANQTIIAGQRATQPNSTKMGYILEGWYADPELTNKYYFDTPVDGNLTLYANWVEKPAEVEDGSLKAQFVLEEEAGEEYANGEFVTEVSSESGIHYEHVYTGAKIMPAIVVTNGTKVLTEGVDYTVKYSNNVNVDKKGRPAVVSITGKGNYTGKDELNFFVTKKSLEDDDVYVGSTRIAENTKAAPVLTYNGAKLAAKDYVLQTVGSDGKASGIAAGKIALSSTQDGRITLIAVAKDGNYSGEKEIEIEVLTAAAAKTELKKFKVDLAKDVNKKFFYDGLEKTLSVSADGVIGDLTVYDAADKTKGTLLEESEDGTDNGFFVSYSANVNAGTVKVTIVGCGEYVGTVTKSFKILPNKTAAMDVVLEQENGAVKGDASYDHFTFRKAGVTPGVVVAATFTNADGVSVEKTLTEGVDFKVSYAGNKKVSTAKSAASYTVTYLGNYKGTATLKKQPYTIDQAAFNEVDMKVTVNHMPYANTGKTQKAAKYLQAPYVELNGELLAKSEYNVTYKVKDAEGSFTQEITKQSVMTAPTDEKPVEIQVVVTPKSANYKASDDVITAEYEVYYTDKTDISKAKVTLRSRMDNKGNVTANGKKISKVYYTGSAISFDPEDENRQADLVVTVNKVDYVGAEAYKYFDVEYVNNVNKGKATVIVTAKDRTADNTEVTFTGSKAGTFTIAAVNLKIWKVWLETLTASLRE